MLGRSCVRFDSTQIFSLSHAGVMLIFTCHSNVVLEPFIRGTISTLLAPITTIKGHSERGFSFFNRLGMNTIIDLPLRLFTISVRKVDSYFCSDDS